MDLLTKTFPDLLLILAQPDNSTGLEIFQGIILQNSPLKQLISPEGKHKEVTDAGSLTAIDSFFPFCYSHTHNLNQQLHTLSPILALMGADLLIHLHPAVQAHFRAKAWVIEVQKAGEFTLTVPNGPKRGSHCYSIGPTSEGFVPIGQGKRPLIVQNEPAFTDLSFSVNLSDKQRGQKDSLVLPYWSAKNSGESAVISYYHEKVDDFDEEDPDADLDL